MTDLGFGLADRRSVMVVLFIFLLSNVILGNPLPVDTTDLATLFFSLVVLTGFLFAARTASRVLIATVYTAFVVPLELLEDVRYERRRHGGTPTHSAAPSKADPRSDAHLSDHIRSWATLLWQAARSTVPSSLRHGLVIPLFRMRDWDWTVTHPFLPLLGIADRILILLLALAATLPAAAQLRYLVGLAGVVLLIAAYVATGRFTIVVKDAFHQSEIDHNELVGAAATQPSYPSVVYTKPALPDYG